MLDEFFEIVIFYFGREGGGEGGGVEVSDGGHGGAAGDHGGPDGVDVVTQGRDPAHAGDDDARFGCGGHGWRCALRLES